MCCPGLGTQFDCNTKNLIQILLSTPRLKQLASQLQHCVKKVFNGDKKSALCHKPGSILNWLTKIIVVGADIPKICSFALCDTIHPGHHPHNARCSCKYLILTLIERKDTKIAGSSTRFDTNSPVVMLGWLGIYSLSMCWLTWSGAGRQGPISSNNGAVSAPTNNYFRLN